MEGWCHTDGKPLALEDCKPTDGWFSDLIQFRSAGDAAPAAHRVAAVVGIPPANVHSSVKPSGKAALVRSLQEQGCRWVPQLRGEVPDGMTMCSADVGPPTSDNSHDHGDCTLQHSRTLSVSKTLAWEGSPSLVETVRHATNLLKCLRWALNLTA